MAGHIRRREIEAGTRYYPVLEVDGKQRTFGSYKTKRDALAKLREVERQAADGSLDKEKAPTFGVFYSQWIASKHNLKPSSLVSYESTFRLHVLPIFEKKRLTEIRPVDVQTWINVLAESGLSPASVARCFRYLRSCLKQAEAWNLIDRAPTAKINLPRSNREELSFLEPDELAALLEAAGEPGRTLYAVLAMSGLRLGEALALRWSDINFEMRCIKVERSWSYWGGFQEPKTAGSRRAVPLLDALANTLRDFYHSNGHPGLDDLLFTCDGEKPLDPRNTLRDFKVTLKSAGLKEVNLHSLRHSYASIMLSCGASVKALQNALGHASATMTLNTYSHLIQADMDAPLARMNQLITGAEGKLAYLATREKK